MRIDVNAALGAPADRAIERDHAWLLLHREGSNRGNKLPDLLIAVEGFNWKEDV